MRDLDADLRRAVFAAGCEHASHRRFMRIVPEPSAPRRDAADRLNIRHRDDDESRAGARKRGQMLSVPIRRDAIVRAVLAQRRHDDAIIERKTTQCDGSEELAHGARDYPAVSARAINQLFLEEMPRAASPAIWRIGGCRRDGPEGRKSPPRGSSGQAAEPLDPHYRANHRAIQVKLISRRWAIETLRQSLSNACTDEVRHIAAKLANLFHKSR